MGALWGLVASPRETKNMSLRSSGDRTPSEVTCRESGSPLPDESRKTSIVDVLCVRNAAEPGEHVPRSQGAVRIRVSASASAASAPPLPRVPPPSSAAAFSGASSAASTSAASSASGSFTPRLPPPPPPPPLPSPLPLRLRRLRLHVLCPSASASSTFISSATSSTFISSAPSASPPAIRLCQILPFTPAPEPHAKCVQVQAGFGPNHD